MADPSSDTIAVIGAGIVGISTAIWLQRQGHRVTVIDRTGPAGGTSYGNAGVLASCSVVPVTVPGLIGKAPGMLLDPDSPLFMRWSYLPRMLPWLARYLAHCRPDETRRIAAALTTIIGDSVEQHRQLAAGTGAEKWIVASDYIYAYRDRAAFEADRFGWEIRRAEGFDWEEMDGPAFRAYDPGFADAVGFAVRVGNHGHITDPGAYVTDLCRHFERGGGTLRKAEVADFLFEGGRLSALATDQGAIACTRAVVATGAWSKSLMSRLGLDVPLESERGYHVELVEPSVMPRAPTMVAAGKFVATPMDGRLRCAGIVEFGGLDKPPSEKPFALLIRRITEAMPGLRWRETRKWMGHRPAPADSIPLIGEISTSPGVYVGFGHHHIGLTGGPKTGRMLADAISGRRPNVDFAPYRPDRFAN